MSKNETRILWVSTYSLQLDQIKDLRRIYGKNVKITQIISSFDTISDDELKKKLSDVDILAVDLRINDISINLLNDLFKVIKGKQLINAESEMIEIEENKINKSCSKIQTNSTPKHDTSYKFIHKHWTEYEFSLKIKIL